MARFLLRHGPFCPETWSVSSGPFCPWSVLSEYRFEYVILLTFLISILFGEGGGGGISLLGVNTDSLH